MLDVSTSIDSAEIEKIKNIIIKEGTVEKEAFNIKKNFDVLSGATHYPIIFIVDVSSSLRPERENLNTAIRGFIKDIVDSRTTLSSSIDFSIVTFADKVKIKRPFGYISESDLQEDATKNIIGEKELVGLTNMGSGMFVAWYLAEMRKCMYKKAGLKYRQPIFVLISDLRNTESTKVDAEYLITKIISFFNIKYEGKKIGLLKALFGSVEKSYNEQLKGISIDAPIGFAEMLKKIFGELIATIGIKPKDVDNFLESDEDDDVFLPYDNSAQEKDGGYMSEMAKELYDLLNQDCD